MATYFAHCANCDADLEVQQVGPDDQPPQVGAIVLCGQCGSVNGLFSNGFRVLTEVELALLPQEVQKDLAFAVKCIKARVARETPPNLLRN